MKGYDMRSIAPTVSGLLGVEAPGGCEVSEIGRVLNDMGYHRRLAVVVIDALGASIWDGNRGVTPTLNALSNEHLIRIRAVEPAKTPVNFATMATGAHPDVHGIRDRTEKLGLETLFDVLRRRGMRSGVAARAMSSLGMLLAPLADLPRIAQSNLDEDVTRLAVEMIEGEAPEFVWVQLLDVDSVGHKYGTLSDELREAVKGADRHLRDIVGAMAGRGYGLLAFADHGQHDAIDPDTGRRRGTHDGSVEEDLLVPFIWRGSGEIGRFV
ncbi:MAG: alkaline phosphatase family protein [bacterium]